MPPLHRHQLVRLTDAGWLAVAARPWDDEAAAVVAHWAAHRLPLVVTRQPPADGPGVAAGCGTLALGLAAPSRWQRRRLALAVERHQIGWFDEFPAVQALVPTLSQRSRPACQRLGTALAALGVTARAYGSHGWQMMSGLPYLRAGSDLDLWAAVADARQADTVAHLFADHEAALGCRLDGELQFPDGLGCAWREWLAWRSGRARAMLCKTLHGVSLVGPEAALFSASRGAAATVLA